MTRASFVNDMCWVTLALCYSPYIRASRTQLLEVRLPRAAELPLGKSSLQKVSETFLSGKGHQRVLGVLLRAGTTKGSSPKPRRGREGGARGPAALTCLSREILSHSKSCLTALSCRSSFLICSICSLLRVIRSDSKSELFLSSSSSISS